MRNPTLHVMWRVTIELTDGETVCKVQTQNRSEKHGALAEAIREAVGAMGKLATLAPKDAAIAKEASGG